MASISDRQKFSSMWAIFVIISVTLTIPSQVTATSWFIEGPIGDGRHITCPNEICTCNGKIEGINIGSASSKNKNKTESQCQAYYRSTPCTFEPGGNNIGRFRIATDSIGNLTRDLLKGIGYPLRVDKPGGEDKYFYIPMNLENETPQRVSSANITHLSIDLCPTQHSVENDTLNEFSRLQILKISGTNATVNIKDPGLFSRLVKLLSLTVVNVRLQTVQEGDFCYLQSMDKVHLTHTHPSVINGFDCRNVDCEGTCLYSLDTVDLSGNNISTIDFPLKSAFPRVEKLTLAKNLISTIKKDVFRDLTELKTLDLSLNKISFVHHSAFRDLTELKSLDLSLNKISFVHHSAFINIPELNILNLANNNLATFNFSLFQRLRKLTNLSLADNWLQHVDATYFPDTIMEIELQRNNISSISGSAFLSRRRGKFELLNLTNNKLRNFTIKEIASCDDVPCQEDTKMDLLIYGNSLDCNCSMEWLRPYLNRDTGPLRIPDLRSAYGPQQCWNLKDEIDPEVRGVMPLTEEDSVCPCQEVQGQPRCRQEAEQCPLKCKCSSTTERSQNDIYITDCSGNFLLKLPQGIPFKSTLIRLDGNHFGHLRNLTDSGRYSARVLYLNHSAIESVQASFFDVYPNLITLYLHGNQLKELPDQIFASLYFLKNLFIHDNFLSKINVEILSNATFEIEKLTLSGNPWNCDCDHGLPLQKWITPLDIVMDKNDITCGSINLPIVQNSSENSTPYSPRNSSLEYTTIDYIESDQETLANEDILEKSIWKVDFDKCHEKNITVENPLNKDIIVVASVLGVVFFAIVGLAVLAFYHRELILVWMYNSPHTNWFWRPKDEEHDDMKYDAYVVSTIQFSEKIKDVGYTDLGFIQKELSPHLEAEKPHFHLYLEFRDAPLGYEILYNVQQAVDKSRRIIILLTENFLKDNICLEAFSRAHFRSIQDKRMRLIVLLVGDPPRDQMPEDLQNFIKTGSYLKWQEKWFWKKLIYKMPHVSRTPRSLNPPDYFRNKFLGNLPNGDIRHHSFSFSDDGQEIPMGSFFSDSSGLNDTRSENYVHDSSLVSDAYISQCASDFNDDIQKEAILASPEEEMTDEEPKEANSLINGNHV